MSNLSGTIQLEDISVTAPTYRSYHSAAKSLLPGLQQLTDTTTPCGEAITLLAGFIIEPALKAALSRAGKTEADLRSHNLVKLWDDAVACGVPLEQPRPDWVSSLNVFHAAPYYIRYHTGGGFYSLPPITPMVKGVSAAFEEASKFCLIPLP